MKSLFLAAVIASSLAGCASAQHNHSQAPTATTGADTRPEQAWTHPVDRVPAQATGTSHSFLAVNGATSTGLARCKGSATLSRQNFDYLLKIRGAMCSNLKTAFGEYKLNGEGNKDRWIDVLIDGNRPGYHKVLVGSNKFMSSDGADGNGDYVYVYVPPRAVRLKMKWVSDTFRHSLPNCGGTVEGNISNGQLNIVFRNVNLSRCNSFDIVGNNGDRTDYVAKTLTQSTQSFTIPQKFIQWGSNYLTLSLSRAWQSEDRIEVEFIGIPSFQDEE